MTRNVENPTCWHCGVILDGNKNSPLYNWPKYRREHGEKRREEQKLTNIASSNVSAEPTPKEKKAREFQQAQQEEEQRYTALDSLIENLTGLEFHEQHINRHELMEETKQHRLKIIKQMSDYDVKMTYGKAQSLSILLNDFIQQLDNELDVRHAKKNMVSE